jgi:outer membrane immunogenic protein
MGALRTQAVAVVALLALAAQSGPASADGPVGRPEDPYRYTPYDPAPPAFLVFNWSGFYVGGNVGWGYTSAESTFQVENALTADLDIIDSQNYAQTASYLTGGVQAGWQRQWNTWVFGIEAGYTAVRFDTNEFAPDLIATTSDLTRSVKLSDIFTLTGRVGYAYEQWLAYAKGGWANADVSGTYTQVSTGTVLSTASGRQNGWTAGVGVDYAIHPNLFLGVEYNYMSIRTGLIPPDFTVGPTVAPFNVLTGATNTDTQNVVLRLNYRFGGPRP